MNHGILNYGTHSVHVGDLAEAKCLFCCCSVAKLCDPMDCSTPVFPVLHYFQEFTQTHVIELMMASNHLILCCPLLLLPSIFPSIKVYLEGSIQASEEFSLSSIGCRHNVLGPSIKFLRPSFSILRIGMILL